MYFFSNEPWEYWNEGKMNWKMNLLIFSIWQVSMKLKVIFLLKHLLFEQKLCSSFFTLICFFLSIVCRCVQLRWKVGCSLAAPLLHETIFKAICAQNWDSILGDMWREGHKEKSTFVFYLKQNGVFQSLYKKLLQLPHFLPTPMYCLYAIWISSCCYLEIPNQTSKTKPFKTA